MKRILLLIWISVLAASIVGAIRIGIALLAFRDVPPGPTGPGVGAALVYGLTLFVVCVALIVACSRFRPPRDVFTWTNIFISFLIIAAAVSAFWVGAEKSKRSRDYTVELRFLDEKGAPIPSMSVRCGSLADGEGAALVRGHDLLSHEVTDRDGVITVFANRAQSLHFTCETWGYQAATVELSAIYGKPLPDLHQLVAHDADLQFPPDAKEIVIKEESGSEECRIPTAEKIRITAKLRTSSASSAFPNLTKDNGQTLITETIRSPLQHNDSECRIKFPAKDPQEAIGILLRSWTEHRTAEKREPDWRVEITGEGIGLAVATAESPFNAPATGYTNTLTWNSPNIPKWSVDFDKAIYFKTERGIYGRMDIVFLTWGDNVRIEYAFNPNGSRELYSKSVVAH